MGYLGYRAHGAMYPKERCLAVEKTRYIPETVEKEKHNINELKLRKELGIMSHSYMVWDTEHITDYYDIYTLIRAKKKANLIRNSLITDFNRILDYVDKKNKSQGLKITTNFFSDKVMDQILSLYEQRKIDKDIAISTLYFEDFKYMAEKGVSLEQ